MNKDNATLILHLQDWKYHNIRLIHEKRGINLMNELQEERLPLSGWDRIGSRGIVLFVQTQHVDQENHLYRCSQYWFVYRSAKTKNE